MRRDSDDDNSDGDGEGDGDGGSANMQHVLQRIRAVGVPSQVSQQSSAFFRKRKLYSTKTCSHLINFSIFSFFALSVWIEYLLHFTPQRKTG
jgi:hypothetical protein